MPRPPERLPAPLRPLTVSDVLDGAFAIVKVRPRQILAITAAIVVPVHLAAAWLQRGVAQGFNAYFNAFDTTPSRSASGGAVAQAYLGFGLMSLSLFFVGGAIGRVVSAWYGGGDVTAGAALKASFAKTGPFLAAFFLLLPVKIVSFCFFVLPALVAVPMLSMTAPIIVIEGVGPIAGMRRSVTLAWRRFFPVVGIVLLATAVQLVVGWVLGLVPSLVAGAMDEAGIPFGWVVTGFGSALVSLITVPFLVGVSVLLYLDLRVRTEGLDLELEAVDAFADA